MCIRDSPLLSQNLLRYDIDLAFDTDLLFLDVVNRRIGGITETPGYDLDINGMIKTININIDVQIQAGNVFITGQNQTITTGYGKLFVGDADTIITRKMQTGAVQISNSLITNYPGPGDIQFSPYYQSKTNIDSNVLITGNLHATGDVTADGNIILGNETTDSISILAEITSDLIPLTTDRYELGYNSPRQRWKTLFSRNAKLGALNLTGATLPRTTEVYAGNIHIFGDTITPTNNSDIVFTASSGNTFFSSFVASGNSLQNITPNQYFQFGQVPVVTPYQDATIGFYKFDGSLGVTIPSGPTANRPPALNSVIGLIRFNTDLGYLEVFNGSYWQPARGPAPIATAQDVIDESILWDLILD
jgi:hypothetical protein